jgi:hypothetical protein
MEAKHSIRASLTKLIQDVLMAQDKIWGNTLLTGVEIATPDYE